MWNPCNCSTCNAPRVDPIKILAWQMGLPVCDCCGEQLASITYVSDNLCVGCANVLAGQGEPVTQYGKKIKPRPPR